MRGNTENKKKNRKLILSGAALVISALLLVVSYGWFVVSDVPRYFKVAVTKEIPDPIFISA